MRDFLLTIQYNDPDTNVVSVLYFSGRGYTSRPTDTPANTYFAPMIANPGSISQSMYSPGATGGNSSGGFGFMELINSGGELDYLIDYSFDGWPCELYEGDSSQAFSTFALLISGTIEQLEFNWNKITVRYKDLTSSLDKPVALHYYAGTNSGDTGIEGTDDLKGKPKPRLFGSAYNITPVCVNANKRIYQVNDGAATVTAIRDGGATGITIEADQLNATDLKNATITPGAARTCIAEGLFRLGSSPQIQITCDAYSSLPTTIGQTIKTLVTERVAASTTVEQSIRDLDAYYTASYIHQLYTGTDVVTTRQALDYLATAGIWWGFDGNSQFWVRQFDATTATPMLQLTKNNITSIERVATRDNSRGVPVWRVNCRYKKNNTVQTSLAESLNQTLYATEWLDAVYTDPFDGSATGVRTAHLNAVEVVIDTPFTTFAEAYTEATRQFNMRSGRRDRLRVTVPLSAIKYPDSGYWDDDVISELPVAGESSKSVRVGTYLYTLLYNTTPSVPKVVRLNLTDPSSTWESLTNPPTTIGEYPSLVTDDTYLYLIANTKIYRYTLGSLSNPWTDTGCTLTHRTSRICAYYSANASNKYIYLFGGQNISFIPSEKVFRVKIGVWTEDDAGVADFPISIAYAESYQSGATLWIAGGTFGTYFYSVNLSTPSVAATALTSLPVATQGHVLCGSFGTENKIWMMGGTAGSGVWRNSVYTYDISTNAWTQNIADMPSLKGYASGTYYNGAIYVVGGWIGGGTGTDPRTYRLRRNENPADRAELTSLGRSVTVTATRYDYSTGKNMKIIGTEQNYAARNVTLELWG